MGYGAQMDRKWTGSGLEVTGSGLEVSICPSVRLSIPNTSLTSLTNLMRGIYKRRALAPCDFLLYIYLCRFGVLSNRPENQLNFIHRRNNFSKKLVSQEIFESICFRKIQFLKFSEVCNFFIKDHSNKATLVDEFGGQLYLQKLWKSVKHLAFGSFHWIKRMFP